MSDITNKTIVLRLNSAWNVIGITTVKDALTAMNSCSKERNIAAKALNIEYEQINQDTWDFGKPLYIEPVSWDEWIKLPIRDFDFIIRTPRLILRAPTVIVSLNYSKMPKKFLRPSNKNVFERDNYTCQVTGKKLSKNQLSVDHLVPSSRGGKDEWTNLVTMTKEINHRKSDLTLDEIGLKLLKQPKAPLPMPISSLIREVKHSDWKHFLIK